WWDLWTAAVRIAPEKIFAEGVARVLDDATLGEDERKERLRALAGVSKEWNWPGLGLARIHGLDDDLASKFYERYPDLVRGPFRAHVTLRWWSKGHAKLLSLAQAAGDDEFVDILAARYATRLSWEDRLGRTSNKKDPLRDTVKELAQYYQ